ncbi:PSD1 and planctomycete cytochrome C domain-containing protein [Portibacter lacus]|uniref:Cytochrome c n=1 Tax=Portibacter lacus TaxID=1099794 RepID=A0AA37SVP4_9BACT|nr:PSD1 and planctomycete cytochrome C domain-containing protein [Portibacter lacus]GLR18680.1 cytochrome c [Portibacter lacus]
MKGFGLKFLYFILFSFFLLCQCADKDSSLPETVDFNYHIRPILSQNCYTCHGPDPSSRKANLRLDTYDGATSKLPNGNYAILPGKPGRSSLIDRVTSDDEEEMMPPPETKKVLTGHEIALIEKWIDQGAKWKKHWAFIPPQETKLRYNNIDDYIQEGWEKNNLDKGELADRNVLIRRLSYLLTGLPPSLDEINEFQNSDYEDIVDYYLESKHFGEHWARHWMDLVRYAEKMGHEFDFTIGGAHHYRDYLIRAFNNDVPYDQFVLEQLAGDQLEEPRYNEEGINESIIGTAYAFLGEGKHSPVDIKQEEADRIDNMIDVTSKTFQGLTVSCAKCHDHKFDPIPTTDYYAMYGMFESSRIGPIAFNRSPSKDNIAEEIEPINAQLKNEVAEYIDNIDLEKKYNLQEVKGDFRGDDFDGWYADGYAFGKGPLYEKFASSNYYGKGIMGSLRSPTFEIADSFIYVNARGKASSIRVIVDNFQLIQNPLYGNLERHVNSQYFQLERMNVTALKGHKAYIEILPGWYNRHHYTIGKEDYIEVEYVFTSDQKFDRDTTYLDTLKTPNRERLYAEKAEKSKNLQDSTFVMGFTEGDAVFSPVFIRGSHVEPSKERVKHQFLTAISPAENEFKQEGSGRKAWAESVVNPENPLTARVMVNRIWHHLFGKGIVETVDNYGLQGSLPSHPELLDYLAITFMEEDWSVKKMIKSMVMTEAFQQSTTVNLDNSKNDPQNKYLSSFRIRRLTAESIRDGILSTTGSLNDSMYGEPVPVHLTEFMNGRGRPSVSGPLDGNGRRSIYISINRNFLSPMMLTFDMPIPFSTFGKRNTTNVPAQSLTLMNDPFVHEETQKWASRLLADSTKTTEERITQIYLQAYVRAPSPEEIENGVEIIGEFGAEAEEAAWKNYCHIIMNTKEFIHLL